MIGLFPRANHNQMGPGLFEKSWAPSTPHPGATRVRCHGNTHFPAPCNTDRRAHTLPFKRGPTEEMQSPPDWPKWTAGTGMAPITLASNPSPSNSPSFHSFRRFDLTWVRDLRLETEGRLTRDTHYQCDAKAHQSLTGRLRLVISTGYHQSD